MKTWIYSVVGAGLLAVSLQASAHTPHKLVAPNGCHMGHIGKMHCHKMPPPAGTPDHHITKKNFAPGAVKDHVKHINDLKLQALKKGEPVPHPKNAF